MSAMFRVREGQMFRLWTFSSINKKTANYNLRTSWQLSRGAGGYNITEMQIRCYFTLAAYDCIIFTYMVGSTAAFLYSPCECYHRSRAENHLHTMFLWKLKNKCSKCRKKSQIIPASHPDRIKCRGSRNIFV